MAGKRWKYDRGTREVLAHYILKEQDQPCAVRDVNRAMSNPEKLEEIARIAAPGVKRRRLAAAYISLIAQEGEEWD